MAVIQECKAESNDILILLKKEPNVTSGRGNINYSTEEAIFNKPFPLTEITNYYGTKITKELFQVANSITLYAGVKGVEGCRQAQGTFTISKSLPKNNQLTYQLGPNCTIVEASQELKGDHDRIEESLPLVKEGR